MGANYYTILDVARDATAQELKTAYRTLAHRWHPDKNPGDPSAHAQFQRIGEAYAVLSDPGQRERYDRGEEVVLIGAGAAEAVVRQVIDAVVFQRVRRPPSPT